MLQTGSFHPWVPATATWSPPLTQSRITPTPGIAVLNNISPTEILCTPSCLETSRYEVLGGYELPSVSFAPPLLIAFSKNHSLRSDHLLPFPCCHSSVFVAGINRLPLLGAHFCPSSPFPCSSGWFYKDYLDHLCEAFPIPPIKSSWISPFSKPSPHMRVRAV